MADKKKASREVLHRYYRAQIRKIDPESFTVDALVSDGTVDRHGTIIQPEAWKKDLKFYKDHPVLLASHTHGDLLAQIGEAKSVKVTDEGLETRFVYYAGEGNPQADWAWNLVMHGMAMFSVGFIAHEQERPEYKEDKKQDPLKDPHTIYTRVELAEVSQVTVGSNRNALQRAIDGAVIEGKPDPDVAMLAELAADITESMKKGEIKEIEESASPAPGDGEGAGEEVPPEPAPAPLGDKDNTDPKGYYDPNQLQEETQKDAERPYPNEHACRLREPSEFKKGSFVRMDRDHKGKKYSVILGKLKGEDTLTEQAYRYDKDTWSPQQAEKHCKDHDGSFEAASGKGVMVEIDAAEIRALREIVEEVKSLLTKLNDKLELFTPEELKALLGCKDAKAGADEAHKAPNAATAILEKDKGEDKGQSSELASIIAQAETVKATLKG